VYLEKQKGGGGGGGKMIASTKPKITEGKGCERTVKKSVLVM